MMNRVLPILMLLLLAVLVLLGAAGDLGSRPSADTPAGAVSMFFGHVKDHDLDTAFQMIAPESNLDKQDFLRQIAGSNNSLKTISTLQSAETKTLSEAGDRATVRADLEWSTAVGAIAEQRDLQLTRADGRWKIVWPGATGTLGELRTEPTDYLRWDIIQRRATRDDWGGQSVEPPNMRVVSMNPIEHAGGVIILGELVNEDTVPGFVTVTATLIDRNGNPFVEESSFDKISHTLLPKEVSPFRIDFPGVKLADIKSVRLNPIKLLVPATADPVVGVMDQRLEKDANGSGILRGELVNQSGKPVNIPHVLATFYDDSGRVIWVSDGYVQSALLPNVPVAFSLAVRDDMLKDVQSYRVTVNHYSADRSGSGLL
jgi:hypothetical protein